MESHRTHLLQAINRNWAGQPSDYGKTILNYIRIPSNNFKRNVDATRVTITAGNRNQNQQGADGQIKPDSQRIHLQLGR